MGDKTSPSKTLTDSDIATYQRRTGPAAGAAATDADAHSDADAHAHTDSDAAPKAGSDADAAKSSDRDS